MSITDRIDAVLTTAASTNPALAAVITQGREITDDEAESMCRYLRSSSEVARVKARKVIDYAALEQPCTPGEAGLMRQISEAADVGWYAAGEASGKAVKIAVAAGKWSSLGESEVDRYWKEAWSVAWQAVSDAARAKAAMGLLPEDAVEQHHYEALLGPWRATVEERA